MTIFSKLILQTAFSKQGFEIVRVLWDLTVTKPFLAMIHVFVMDGWPRSKEE